MSDTPRSRTDTSRAPAESGDLAPLEVTFDLVERDQVRLGVRQLLRSRVILLLPLVILLLNHYLAEDDASAFWVLGPSLALLVTIPASLYFLIRHNVRGLREGQRRVTIGLTPARFVVADLETRSELAWESLSHFSERADGFDILDRRGCCWWLPKAALTETQADLARRWLTSRLSDRPRRAGGSGCAIWGTVLAGVALALFWYAYHRAAGNF